MVELSCVVPPTAGIADEIHSAHAEAEEALRSGVQHAIKAGELLLKEKERYGQYGQWAAWLAENIKFSPRLVQAYMRLAQLPLEKRNAVADLPLRDALSAIRSRVRVDTAADKEARVTEEKPPKPVETSPPAKIDLRMPKRTATARLCSILDELEIVLFSVPTIDLAKAVRGLSAARREKATEQVRSMLESLHQVETALALKPKRVIDSVFERAVARSESRRGQGAA